MNRTMLEEPAAYRAEPINPNKPLQPIKTEELVSKPTGCLQLQPEYHYCQCRQSHSADYG
jgi:hypothetical protein